MKGKGKLTNALNKGAIAGLIIVVLSFVIPIVPCTTSPVIAEPVYKLGLCKLQNPFVSQELGVLTKYYGAFPDPLAGAIIQFIIIAVIVSFIFMKLNKKTAKMAKVLDLSKK
jgi:large-conductance mechanosensitive channel|tara:strand:- start:635 stop:970 length:336 start_codon:yes stop_codon:yes gene_type:complete